MLPPPATPPPLLSGCCTSESSSELPSLACNVQKIVFSGVLLEYLLVICHRISIIRPYQYSLLCSLSNIYINIILLLDCFKLLISIQEYGTYYLGGISISDSELAGRLSVLSEQNPGIKLRIRADRKTAFADIRIAMTAASDAGISDYIYGAYQGE